MSVSVLSVARRPRNRGDQEHVRPGGDGVVSGRRRAAPALGNRESRRPGVAVAGFHAPLPVVDGEHDVHLLARDVRRVARYACDDRDERDERDRDGIAPAQSRQARVQQAGPHRPGASQDHRWSPIRLSRTRSSRASCPAAPARRRRRRRKKTTTRIDGSRRARPREPSAARWPRPGTTSRAGPERTAAIHALRGDGGGSTWLTDASVSLAATARRRDAARLRWHAPRDERCVGGGHPARRRAATSGERAERTEATDDVGTIDRGRLAAWATGYP